MAEAPSRVSGDGDIAPPPGGGGAWPGIAFAVLSIVAAAMMLGGIPDPEDGDQTIVDYYGATATHFIAIAGYVVLVVAAMFFIWFLLDLHDLLADAEGGRAIGTRFAFVSGLIFAVMLIAAGGVLTAIPGAIEVGGAPSTLDPDWMRVMPQLGFGLLRVAAGPMAAACIFTTSVLSLRTGVLPRGTAWAGFVLGVIELIVLTPVPMLGIPIWVAIISVALLRRRSQAAGVTSA